RFLSQPFQVAEVFTGMEGRFVPLEDTLRGFEEILDGVHDRLPEQAFYMVGDIEEVKRRAEQMLKDVDAKSKVEEKQTTTEKLDLREHYKKTAKLAIETEKKLVMQNIRDRNPFPRQLVGLEDE